MLHQPASGLYKIGRALDVDGRLRQINVRMEGDRRVVLVHVWEVEDPRGVEHDLHRTFGDTSRHHPDLPREGRREWFALSARDLQAVRVHMLLGYLRTRLQP